MFVQYKERLLFEILNWLLDYSRPTGDVRGSFWGMLTGPVEPKGTI